MSISHTKEYRRLAAARRQTTRWLNWGPYLSERAWGTVREDYSPHGTAWDYLPHDHARSKAFRWGEDGIAGFSDRQQYLCFGLALWNGHDPILKERFFGLAGPEGNHGEDVKEVYFYLDSTPTHSYMKLLYKYPHAAFPYSELVAENRRRGATDPEFELTDTGVFDENRYFDVLVEFAKADPHDILIAITVTNRADISAECHLLPTLWFRNTWVWGYPAGPMGDVPGKPLLRQIPAPAEFSAITAEHPALPPMTLSADGAPEWLFTENETNTERLYGTSNRSPFVKDAFHRYLIHGEKNTVNPQRTGTKAAALYPLTLAGGESRTVRLRLNAKPFRAPFRSFEKILERRRAEADEFYHHLHPATLSADDRRIQRQALAGMLWSKQLYYFDVEQWLTGDPAPPPPPAERRRNSGWQHLNNFDIISMPDTWEYPWYAAWDLAFHTLPLALVDADFAKQQLLLITREWYMHPNGQFPAYEWAFGDVNPPVQAWAAWRVYKIDAKLRGRADRPFLETVFHKLLLNFTWWVNRKDADGNNIFQGGFLGLDNISVFDRSALLPTGGHIDQADGTAWMGAYCLTMMKIALELAHDNPVYQDLATKFFEHFLGIARAMTRCGGTGHTMWDETDGFFYDALHLPNGEILPLKVRSMVGLLPLFAVETIEPDMLDALPDFRRHVQWFLRHRPQLSGNIASVDVPGEGKRRLAAILPRERLVRVLEKMLDPAEFLSDYGIRSVSKFHAAHPYMLHLDGKTYTINYQPAESENGLFGGNSNWRGPVWFPINYLIIESLQKFHHYYGDSLRVACPTGSGQMITLQQVADELSRRLVRLFRRENNRRPIYGKNDRWQSDSHWRDNLLFFEYFHGDSGAGLGASHQTGWTGLVAKLIQQQGEHHA